MSEQRPTPPSSAARETDALRQTGATPLRSGDPDRVGPYVPLALLGSGGMGRVYLARAADDSAGLFAVKVIRPEYAEDARFRRRFEHEVSVHSRVGPPYAPKLCGAGLDDELLWMANEYLPAVDLAAAVREDGALRPAAVWQLVAGLGQALSALAGAGIVHRDLKPSNVLLSVRGAHLIDFGIAKAAEASAITGTGNRVGTPAYMSPEYLRTGHCDTTSDVFSLAGTLVYAATGRAPFGDGTGVDVMHRVAFEEPNPEVIGALAATDPVLGSLLSDCLAKEPHRRPTPQHLIDTAEAHSGSPGWPEPLNGRVLAQQRAYEVLYHLPVERAEHLRPPGSRGKLAPAPPPARPEAPPEVPQPVAESGAVPSRPTSARPWTRKKRVLVVTAGITLSALCAGILVLTRQDGRATAAPPGTTATAAGTMPGAAHGSPAPPSASGVSDRASAAGSSSGRAGSAEGNSAAAGSGSTPEARRTDSTAPTATTTAIATSDPSASATSGTAAQPWNTDCTYYPGSGRTGPGDSGKRVLQVQCMLTKRGYDLGSTGVDGDFGTGTETAVQNFQNDKGLTANGIVARTTWVALRSAD